MQFTHGYFSCHNAIAMCKAENDVSGNSGHAVLEKFFFEGRFQKFRFKSVKSLFPCKREADMKQYLWVPSQNCCRTNSSWLDLYSHHPQHHSAASATSCSEVTKHQTPLRHVTACLHGNTFCLQSKTVNSLLPLFYHHEKFVVLMFVLTRTENESLYTCSTKSNSDYGMQLTPFLHK